LKKDVHLVSEPQKMLGWRRRLEVVCADLLLKVGLALKVESLTSLDGKARWYNSSIFLSFPVFLSHEEVRFLTTVYAK